MSVNYSFKHHFNWPLPSANPASGPLPAAAAAPLPYTHYDYGGRMFRPRFGLFRRFFWFGLGVGAASWYINKKQEERRLIQSGDVDPSSEAGRKPRWGWGCHSDYHARRAAPVTAAPPAPAPIVGAAQDPRPDLRAPLPSTPSSAVTTPTPGTDDLAALRSTLDRLMREKAAEMGELQVKAKAEAREYAKEKLDKLSVILEGLKETLNKEVDDKAKKLV